MDAWDAGYNRANNSIQDISSLVSERDAQRRGGASGSAAADKVRLALSNLDRNLSTLDSTLVKLEASPPPGTTARDLSRRREDLRRLQSERTRLKTLEKTSLASSDRDSLLRSGGNAGVGQGQESVATRDLTQQQLVDRTEDEMKTQDAIVEQLSSGLTVLTKVSHAIGDEASLHIALLDKLETEVDRGTDNLQQQTKRAKTLSKASAECWLYVVICLLVLVLVILIGYRWG